MGPIEVGDTVELHAAPGKRMYVAEVKGDRVKCTWLDTDETVQHGWFDADALRFVERAGG